MSTQNLQSFYRGDSREYLITFTDADSAVIDITGWTVYFTVKLSYMDADADAKITKDITTHYDPTNGQTKITLLTTDTDIDPANYYYDIQAKKAAGDIFTVMAGRIEILSDITRRMT